MRGRIGLVVGLVLFVAALVSPAPAGMTLPAWLAAAVGVLMASWWIAETIPIPATALLPLVLFPVLGVLNIDAAAAPYANSVIFLFRGDSCLQQPCSTAGWTGGWHLPSSGSGEAVRTS